MVQVMGRVVLTCKKTSWVTGQPIFTSSQKNWARVGLSQEILTRFTMSNLDLLFFL